MKRLGAVLPSVLSHHHLSHRLREFKVLTQWEEAVGISVAHHATAVDIQKGQLTVRVDHPIWSHQLSLLKPSLMARLNAAVGASVVSDIRFSL